MKSLTKNFFAFLFLVTFVFPAFVFAQTPLNFDEQCRPDGSWVSYAHLPYCSDVKARCLISGSQATLDTSQEPHIVSCRPPNDPVNPGDDDTVTSRIFCTPGRDCESLQRVCVASQGTSRFESEDGRTVHVCTRPRGAPIVNPYQSPNPPPAAGSNGEFIPLVGLPGDFDSDDFGSYINFLYVLSISLAALLAVIKIIVAGVKWMLTDVVTAKADAKRDITGALLGLLIVLSAVVILTWINPNLVEFDILAD